MKLWEEKDPHSLLICVQSSIVTLEISYFRESSKHKKINHVAQLYHFLAYTQMTENLEHFRLYIFAQQCSLVIYNHEPGNENKLNDLQLMRG